MSSVSPGSSSQLFYQVAACGNTVVLHLGDTWKFYGHRNKKKKNVAPSKTSP